MSNPETREEWEAWGNSLGPGDKVIVNGWGTYNLDQVKKKTPSGWIVTEKHGAFWQRSWTPGYRQRGGFKSLIPVTEDLERQAREAEEKRIEAEKIYQVIRKARAIAQDWAFNLSKSEYDTAQKIIEIFEEGNKTDE